MKVLFVPWYYYIQFDLFQIIIKKNFEKGIKSFFLYSRNFNQGDSSIQNYYVKNLEKYGVNVLKPILFQINYCKIFLSAFYRVFQLFNLVSLYILFFFYKPDCLIIGSSLGNIYIRFLQMICYKKKIPVLSLWVTKDTPDNKKYSLVFEKISEFLKIEYLLNWSANSIENKNVLYLAPGESIKKHLLSIGINEENIKIIGNPLFEKNIEYKNVSRKNYNIVFFTEVIQEIYGEEYLKYMLRLLDEIFKIYFKSNQLIIKFHPREPENIKQIYKSVFNNNIYIFAADNISVSDLLKTSKFSIAHFSAVLGLSLILDIPALSINFSENTFFYNDINESLLVASNVIEFENKIILLLNEDNDFMNKYALLRNRWLEFNYQRTGVDSVDIIYETIISKINKK